MRNSLLTADNVGETIAEFRDEVLTNAINQHLPPQSLPEQWDIKGLEATLRSDFALDLPLQKWLDEDDHLHEERSEERRVGKESRSRWSADDEKRKKSEQSEHVTSATIGGE